MYWIIQKSKYFKFQNKSAYFVKVWFTYFYLWMKLIFNSYTAKIVDRNSGYYQVNHPRLIFCIHWICISSILSFPRLHLYALLERSYLIPQSITSTFRLNSTSHLASSLINLQFAVWNYELIMQLPSLQHISGWEQCWFKCFRWSFLTFRSFP